MQHKQPKNYLVPTVIERNPMGDRAYDIYSRLLNERIIFLGEEVNEHTANLVVAQMIHLAYEDSKKDILFYINSPGGSVYDGLAIIDTMNYIKPDVQTIGIGMQASMGAVLLAAGAKGKRSLLPNSRVMIHQPHGGTQGVMTDMEISLKEGIRTKELLIDMMVKYTGQKRDKVRADMERDLWMDAKEAIKYGIIDSIIEKA
jgi:ATP-dependent Clp protease, protease subunit